jgi:hypothetical protein
VAVNHRYTQSLVSDGIAFKSKPKLIRESNSEICNYKRRLFALMTL